MSDDQDQRLDPTLDPTIGRAEVLDSLPTAPAHLNALQIGYLAGLLLKDVEQHSVPQDRLARGIMRSLTAAGDALGLTSNIHQDLRSWAAADQPGLPDAAPPPPPHPALDQATTGHTGGLPTSSSPDSEPRSPE